MSKRCRHENADHLMLGDRIEVYEGDILVMRGFAHCEQLRCIDCAHWLSLGESNDADERVDLEIRAAELAAHRNGWLVLDTIDKMEMVGFAQSEAGVIESREYQSGYLARCISTHEEA